jgi:GxxExxY protein
MLKHENLTQVIIECFYDVYKTLGYGFLEKVYENSLAIALRERGINVKQQEPVTVYYHGQKVGIYFADLLVNDLVIVEVKSVQRLAEEHQAQTLNYLKATGLEVGLLVNFGPKPEFKRKIFETARITDTNALT